MASVRTKIATVSSSPLPESREKALYIQALNQWTASAKIARAIEADEYARLDSLARMLIIRNGLIANMVMLCRKNPRQDSRMAVLAFITFFADNDKFCCELTIKRIAEILSRKEDNIREAIRKLEEDGAIGIEWTKNGLPKSYWPRVSPRIIESRASITWFADAFSAQARPRGRPKKTPPVDGGYFSVETPSPKKTPPVVGKNPPRRGGQYFTKRFHSSDYHREDSYSELDIYIGDRELTIYSSGELHEKLDASQLTNFQDDSPPDPEYDEFRYPQGWNTRRSAVRS